MQLIPIARLLKKTGCQGEIPSMKDFLTTTVSVAWPSITESFLIALVGMVDTIMVGTLGSTAIAAVGLTTQPKFVGLAFFLSLNVAISALVARRRGENDREDANRILMQAILITLGLTILVSGLAVAFAEPILRLAGSAPETHADSVAYFRVIMGGLLFNTLTMVINAAQRGSGNTKIAMRTNLVSNLINVCLNYLLIGGNFGFPALGVTGAAVATVIGSVFGCLMSIRSVWHHESFICLRGSFQVRFERSTLKSIATIGTSTLAEQLFTRMGFLVYAAIVARLGTSAFAAHQIGMNLLSMSFSFADGLSVAAVALVGRSLGEQRPDLANLYGAICQRIGFLFSAVLSVIFVSLGRPIFMLFIREADVLQYSMMIMLFMSIITFLQISAVIFSGCLRAAGDTVYTAFVGFVSVAFIRPLAGFLLAFPLGLGLTGAWMGIALDQLTRVTLTFLRFRGGKWMHIKI